MKKTKETNLDIIIITGLSGSGKSHAVRHLEDHGYYCIDNLPPSLIGSFVDLIARSKQKVRKAAFVTDIRGGEFFGELKDNLKDLKDRGIDYKIIFIDARDEVLIRRFSENRRAHPLGAGRTYAEAIETERAALEPIRRVADHTIDTSELKNADLAAAINRALGGSGEASEFNVVVQSFGYKYGIPAEADIVLDMRFVPNPFYVDSLKHLTGKSRRVREYVMRSPEAVRFIDSIVGIFDELKPAFVREGKNSLNISFGCTGGQHRSVAAAITVHERLLKKGEKAVLKHRDI
ncbi:MAG: RNase adapter RapZ [Clostridiales Family XIII bacterium]|jgi:UPF0042 nucleotide-binding protein|nr:RNase adapter RapZ [Clostridiales Family XIII bacterium]